MTFPTAEAAHEAMDNARPFYLPLARWHAEIIWQEKGEVTVDDVREVCPPPPDADPRIMGAIFKTKEWMVERYQKSGRATCHKRPVAVFKKREARRG